MPFSKSCLLRNCFLCCLGILILFFLHNTSAYGKKRKKRRKTGFFSFVDSARRYRKRKTVACQFGLDYYIKLDGFYSFSCSYIASADFQISGQYSYGSPDLENFIEDPPDLPISFHTYEANSSIISVDSRYFMGKSFFIEGGLSYINHVGTVAFDFSGEWQIIGEISSVALNIGIGHQVVFKNGFLLSLQWLGIRPAVSSDSTIRVTFNGKDNSEAFDTPNFEEPNLIYSGLSIGYAF